MQKSKQKQFSNRSSSPKPESREPGSGWSRSLGNKSSQSPKNVAVPDLLQIPRATIRRSFSEVAFKTEPDWKPAFQLNSSIYFSQNNDANDHSSRTLIKLVQETSPKSLKNPIRSAFTTFRDNYDKNVLLQLTDRSINCSYILISD